jgi:hypothetical protein
MPGPLRGGLEAYFSGGATLPLRLFSMSGSDSRLPAARHDERGGGRQADAPDHGDPPEPESAQRLLGQQIDVVEPVDRVEQHRPCGRIRDQRHGHPQPGAEEAPSRPGTADGRRDSPPGGHHRERPAGCGSARSRGWRNPWRGHRQPSIICLTLRGCLSPQRSIRPATRWICAGLVEPELPPQAWRSQ